MKKIMLSAFVLADAQNLTGIQRVCREVILRLDKMIENTDIQVEYLFFEDASHKIIKLEELKNIKPVAFKRRKKNILTKIFDLPKYVKKENGLLVCIDLDYAACKGYIPCIPDMRPVLKESLDDKRFKFYFKNVVLRCAKRYASYIVTHSEFQKQIIVDFLKIKPERVKIIQHGCDHMNYFAEDDSIFEKFRELGKKGEKKYFYTLANIAPNKNFKWIYEMAQRNPEKIFAVAGAMNQFGSAHEYLNLKNIIYLGRVSDEENKALMKNCKAFLFPSKYEGFGLPPLEALYCGAPICVSNATCLPEIYGDCAHYFDPDDYEVDLDKLLKEKVANPKKLLEKFTWDNSTKEWLELMIEEAKKDGKN